MIERLSGERTRSAPQGAAPEQDDWEKQVDVFAQAYPDVDLEELNDDEQFLRFARGRRGDLLERYEAYQAFAGEARAQAMAKFDSRKNRSTALARPAGAGNGLTPQEQEALAAWNMQYPHMSMSQGEWLENKRR